MLSDLITTKECRYGRMTWLRADTYIGRSLDLYGEWGEGEIVLFRRLLEPGASVVDAGANIGTHTVALARVVGSSGAVHAIEPQQSLYDILLENVKTNGLAHVKTHNAGAGAEEGVCRIPAVDYGRPNNFGAIRVGAGEIEVPQITIDGLNLQNIDLLKIDVEGAEIAVLRGASDTINRFRPMLYVECNQRGDQARELVATIRGMGYRIWWHLSAYYNPDNFRRNARNIWPGQFDPYVVCLPSEMTPPAWPLEEVRDRD